MNFVLQVSAKAGSEPVGLAAELATPEEGTAAVVPGPIPRGMCWR